MYTYIGCTHIHIKNDSHQPCASANVRVDANTINQPANAPTNQPAYPSPNQPIHPLAYWHERKKYRYRTFLRRDVVIDKKKN
mmetsp:Transcript_11677/g.22490  ORF Transcript_11677/g.22490 Transcript_11677/m.22490 type:complete len:82 (-) Transcript_11677:570-815(-)